MSDTPRTIVPAQPGFYVLIQRDDGDVPEERAVIAWAIEFTSPGNAPVAPVTIPKLPMLTADAWLEDGTCALKGPDGSVCAATGRRWNSVEEWVARDKTNKGK